MQFIDGKQFGVMVNPIALPTIQHEFPRTRRRSAFWPSWPPTSSASLRVVGKINRKPFFFHIVDHPRMGFQLVTWAYIQWHLIFRCPSAQFSFLLPQLIPNSGMLWQSMLPSWKDDFFWRVWPDLLHPFFERLPCLCEEGAVVALKQNHNKYGSILLPDSNIISKSDPS